MAFEEPEATGGQRIWPKDVINHLLMVWSIEYVPHSQTVYTEPGKLSDMVVVDCVDLDQPDPETGGPGLLARRCWWRNAQLIAALRPKAGKPTPILARMGRGVATKGQPPFILVSATSDPQCVQRANTWLETHPDFVPSLAGGFQEEPVGKPEGHWGKPEEQPAWSAAPPQQAKVQQAVPAETVLERMARLSREQQEAASRLPAARPGFEDTPPY